MKIQDVVFAVTLAFLVYKASSKWSAAVGILSLIASIPLFTAWVFFTAERLTWYAAGFFILAAVQTLSRKLSKT